MWKKVTRRTVFGMWWSSDTCDYWLLPTQNLTFGRDFPIPPRLVLIYIFPFMRILLHWATLWLACDIMGDCQRRDWQLAQSEWQSHHLPRPAQATKYTPKKLKVATTKKKHIKNSQTAGTEPLPLEAARMAATQPPKVCLGRRVFDHLPRLHPSRFCCVSF